MCVSDVDLPLDRVSRLLSSGVGVGVLSFASPLSRHYKLYGYVCDVFVRCVFQMLICL